MHWPDSGAIVADVESFRYQTMQTPARGRLAFPNRGRRAGRGWNAQRWKAWNSSYAMQNFE